MITSCDLYLVDLLQQTGVDEPDTVTTLASCMEGGMNKQLTMEVFLRDTIPCVLFCVHSDLEGLFASDDLSQAVDAYNKAGTEDEDTI